MINVSQCYGYNIRCVVHAQFSARYFILSAANRMVFWVDSLDRERKSALKGKGATLNRYRQSIGWPVRRFLTTGYCASTIA
jgi:hypothetical protein